MMTFGLLLNLHSNKRLKFFGIFKSDQNILPVK